MATRFTDDIKHNSEGSDFVVRRRMPMMTQIGLVFIVVFFAIYLSELSFGGGGNDIVFALILISIIGSLAWFTLILVQRNRDLVLATEYQNAMLASAAQLSTRFCLITRRDGAIVYIDTGFQKTFPQFLGTDSRTIDGLLMAAGVPDALYQQIAQMLTDETGGRFTVPFRTADNTPMPMVVTVDVLPRPKGYFLFRGRDYVEKRAEPTGPTQEQLAASAMLAQAIASLPASVIVLGVDHHILTMSGDFSAWLGYAEGDFLPAADKLIYQYAGHPAGSMVNGAFKGMLTFQRKNRTLATCQATQVYLDEGQQGHCIFLHLHQDAAAGTPEGDRGKLNDFVASSPIAVARISHDGIVLECNAPLRELTKQKREEANWKFLELVKEESRTDVTAHFERLLSGQSIARKPLDITLAGDEIITASLYISRLESNPPEIIAQIIDTTEQKNLEQRFAHSQKMQAVGQLAGGVAHDFNNLLTAMIGFCDLLLIRHPAGDQSFADIMQIKQNANRAANLVRQLLAFSRRQTLLPKMLDITDVLAELSNLVRRLIGENIELKVVHGRDLGVVKADQGQLEQVFINLAVNARDAMSNGGRLTIQTTHVVVDKTHPISRNLIPPLEDEAIVDGDYVLVEVIDNGTGIPKKLMQKIFEPFFSTKEVGSGTGLGLATVYGIIKQTGGYIYVTSKEGAGTTFSLFFRRYQHEEVKPVPAEQIERVQSDDLTGKGTVLLVEDETPVRTFAARALRNKGYTVLEADCGENAIEIMNAQGSEVDVIISDVIMPGMNGPSMIESIAPRFPRVKVIFISGYAEDIFVKNYGSEREFNFLPKPFTLKQLASKVKEVMSR